MQRPSALIARLTRRCAAILVSLGCTCTLLAAPPTVIRYQGQLTDDAGVPRTDTVDLGFAIYGTDEGGSSLWSELRLDVQLQNGIIDTALGEVTPLPSSVFTAAQRWLEITVDGVTLIPREKLSSVPYALASDRLGDRTLADVLSRSQHTGTQPPGSISPQGTGSGLNADALDGLDQSSFSRPGHAHITAHGVYFESQDGYGVSTGDLMTSTSNSLCFLTRVSIEETDGTDEYARCQISNSSGTWFLQARIEGWTGADAYVACEARCLSWN